MGSRTTLIQLFRENDSPLRGLIENSRSRDFFVPAFLPKYSFPFPNPTGYARSWSTINPSAVEILAKRLFSGSWTQKTVPFLSDLLDRFNVESKFWNLIRSWKRRNSWHHWFVSFRDIIGFLNFALGYFYPLQ